jgi:cell division septal protein FtsQ
MVDERIARRRAEVRSERRRARLRRTLLVLLLGGLGTAAVWFEQSEHATVTEVTIIGLDRLEDHEVHEVSGVRIGDAALRVRPSAVARDIEALTLVRDAIVRRPGLRTIVIEVRERAPVYVAIHRTTNVLIDRDGVVVDRGRDENLPVVRLVTPPPVPGGLVASHAALANAHRAWTGLSGPLRSRVVAMDAPDEDGLVLILDSGMVVRFGRAELMEEKVRALGAILDDVAGSEVVLIDVRVPGFPVFRID